MSERWPVRHPGIGILHYGSEEEARVAAGTAGQMLPPEDVSAAAGLTGGCLDPKCTCHEPNRLADVPAGQGRGAVTPREAPGAVATTGQPGPQDVLAGSPNHASTQGCADGSLRIRPGLSVVDRVRAVLDSRLRLGENWPQTELAAAILRDLVDGALLVDDETYALAHPGPRTPEDEKVWAWATKRGEWDEECCAPRFIEGSSIALHQESCPVYRQNLRAIDEWYGRPPQSEVAHSENCGPTCDPATCTHMYDAHFPGQRESEEQA